MHTANDAQREDDRFDLLLERLEELSHESPGASFDELLASEPDAQQQLTGRPDWRARLGEQWTALNRINRVVELLRPETPHLPQIPGFEIREILGQGGAGIVYRARQVSLARDVALKVLLAGRFVSARGRVRFQLEAETIARLRHPHVVQVYDHGEFEGLQYLVEEFVPGGTLADRIAALPLPPRAAAEMAETLSAAVHYAHQQRVLHRDLKPTNVLLTDDGQAKIVDFGLAKALDCQSDLTYTGETPGTPAYMAPEQVNGGAVGPATDVYALGAILYEMLVGQRPFAGEKGAALFEQILHAPPTPPWKINARVPVDLAAIALKCLEKEPARRYDSAAALGRDLRRWLDGLPTEAKPLGPVVSTLRWARRRPALAALAVVSGLALMLLIGGGAIYSVQMGRALAVSEQRRQDAVSATRQAETSRNEAMVQRDTNDEYRYAAQMHQALEALGQGDRAAVEKLLAEYDEGARRADLRGFEWHYLRGAINSQRKLLRGHRGQVYSVAYSPDGSCLASGGQDGTIRLWNPTTGQELQTIVAHKSCTNDLSYSPDGGLLVSTSCDHTAKLWNTSTWQVVSTLTGHPDDVLCVAYSPDGQRLATGDAGGIARVWVATSGELQCELQTTTERSAVNSIEWSPDGKLLATSSSHCQLWNTETWQIVPQVESPVAVSLSFSPDQRWVSRALHGASLQFADVRTGEERLRVSLPSSAQKVGYGSQGQQLILAFGDGTARVVPAPTETDAHRAELQRLFTVGTRNLLGHGERVQDFALSPDGASLATASFDGTVRLWDIKTPGGTIPHWRGRVSALSNLCLSGDLTRLTSLSDDWRLVTWDTQTGQELTSVRTGRETRHQFFNDGNSVVAHAEGWAQMYFASGPNWTEWQEQPCCEEGTFRLVISPDGSTVAFASLDGYLRVRRRNETKYLYERRICAAGESHFTGNYINRMGCALSHSGRLLAVIAAESGACEIVDLESGASREMSLPFDHGGLCFSPRDGILAACSGHVICLVDTATGKVLRMLRPEYEPSQVAISPDERTLAVGMREGHLTLWHIPTGQELGTLTELHEGFAGVQFSDDGQSLAAIGHSSPNGWESRTATLYIWRATPNTSSD